MSTTFQENQQKLITLKNLIASNEKSYNKAIELAHNASLMLKSATLPSQREELLKAQENAINLASHALAQMYENHNLYIVALKVNELLLNE